MVSLIWVVLHLLKLHNLVDGDWLNISQLLLIYAVLASSLVQSLVGLVLPYWILVICLLICRAMAPRTNPWLWYTPCTIFVGILDERCVYTRVSIHRKWKRHNSVSLQTIWSPQLPNHLHIPWHEVCTFLQPYKIILGKIGIYSCH